jgi:hypothetical protein
VSATLPLDIPVACSQDDAEIVTYPYIPPHQLADPADPAEHAATAEIDTTASLP